MTDTPNNGSAEHARTPLSELSIQELYFAHKNLQGDERTAMIEQSEAELLQRLFKTDNPIDSLTYQLRALDIMFHQSVMKGCIYSNTDYHKDAYVAQKLYRETVKQLIKRQDQ